MSNPTNRREADRIKDPCNALTKLQNIQAGLEERLTTEDADALIGLIGTAVAGGAWLLSRSETPARNDQPAVGRINAAIDILNEQPEAAPA